MGRLVFVLLVLSIVSVILAAEIGKQAAEIEKQAVEIEKLAPCGGGCVSSSQCERYSGSRNCRCSWFSCRMYSRDGDGNPMEDLADALAKGNYMLTD